MNPALPLAGAAIAALVIGDQVLGRPNPYVDLYSPSRVNTLTNLESVKVRMCGGHVVMSYAYVCVHACPPLHHQHCTSGVVWIQLLICFVG